MVLLVKAMDCQLEKLSSILAKPCDESLVMPGTAKTELHVNLTCWQVKATQQQKA